MNLIRQRQTEERLKFDADRYARVPVRHGGLLNERIENERHAVRMEKLERIDFKPFDSPCWNAGHTWGGYRVLRLF